MTARPGKKSVVESMVLAASNEFDASSPDSQTLQTEEGRDWEQEWLCLVCTFHNRALSLTCEVCQETRPMNAQPLAPSVPPASAVAALEAAHSARSLHWFCAICTYAENDNDRGVCEVCSHPRQAPSVSPSRVAQVATLPPPQPPPPTQTFASATAVVPSPRPPPPVPSAAARIGPSPHATSLPPPLDNVVMPTPKSKTLHPAEPQSQPKKKPGGKLGDTPTDETACSLCCEEFSLQEKGFLPCSCSYKVCIWCWHRLRDMETGCPACRHAYPSEPFQFAAKSSAQPFAATAKGKSKGKKKKKAQVPAAEPTSGHPSASDLALPQTVQTTNVHSRNPEDSSLPPPAFDRAVGASRSQQREQPLEIASSNLPGNPSTSETRSDNETSAPTPTRTTTKARTGGEVASRAQPPPTRDSPLEELMAFLALTPATCKLLLDEDFDTECILDSTVHDFESIGLSTDDSGKLLRWADCNR